MMNHPEKGGTVKGTYFFGRKSSEYADFVADVLRIHILVPQCSTHFKFRREKDGSLDH
jgi:hypothetical protein